VGDKGSYNSLVLTNATLAHTNLGYATLTVADNELSMHNTMSLKDSIFYGQEIYLFKAGSDNQLILDNSQFNFLPADGRQCVISSESTALGNSITFRGTNSLFYVPYKTTLKNDTCLIFEIPIEGYVRAPFQVYNHEFYADAGVTVEVATKAFGLKGGGEVPLVKVNDAKEWGKSGMDQLLGHIAVVDGDNGEFYIDYEGDVGTLMVRVRNEGATMMLLR